MKLFIKLSTKENKALFNFPVYVSLLAANSDSVLDEYEKIAAIKCSHLKAVTCDPLLVDFFKENENGFEHNLERLNKYLPQEKNSRKATIKRNLLNIEKMILKMGIDFTSIMYLEMKSFKEHVLKAHRKVLIRLQTNIK